MNNITKPLVMLLSCKLDSLLLGYIISEYSAVVFNSLIHSQFKGAFNI